MKIFGPLVFVPRPPSRLRWRFISLLIAFSSVLPAQEKISEDTTAAVRPVTKRLWYASDNLKKDRLDLLMDSLTKKYMQSGQNCGLSIAVLLNDSTRYYNYGGISCDTSHLPDALTVYEIGALSNSFCGLLLSIAVTEKRIKLEDEIGKYRSGKNDNLKLNNKPVLIKHLASHTAGLPRLPANLREQKDFDSLDPFRNYTKKLLYEAVGSLALKSEPGLVSDYSLVGMALLAAILEEIYREPFEQLVQKKILIPNKMGHTQIEEDVKDKNSAIGFNDAVKTPSWHFGEINAAGGYRSCTKDLVSYLKYNMGSSAEVDLNTKTIFSGKPSASAGWFIKDKRGKKMYWINGGTAGFSSFVGFMKEDRVGVVILSNSTMNLDYLALGILNSLKK